MATGEAVLDQTHPPVHEGGLYSGGIWSWITTVDHKRIGILYFCTALAFLVLGGLEALALRLQLGSPENTLLSPDLYNQLFTMHGTTMIFFVAMPLSVAFFNYVVPLQIGARDVAFPRLNQFSYWMFLFGGLFLYASFLFGGAPDSGWFAYAPLTLKRFSPGYRMDFYIFGLQLAGIGTIAGGLNFLVTILNLRAPGVQFMRMPLFTWMTFITAILILLAFPPLTIALVFLTFDRMFGTLFFVATGGGDPVLWQHLFWVFGHPEVYILILPAFGMVSDVIPAFSRKELFGYPVVVYAGILIAFLGFGVWVHHMFAVGLGPVVNAVFSGTTMLIAIPTGVKIFNWLATMWGGKIRFSTAMMYAIGLVAMFTIGGISGVMHASPPTDLQQTDTYFIVAHFHYVIAGGMLMGILAGLYYWYPKVTGRLMSETLGKLNFWLFFIGFNVTFFPMHFSGLLGQPRRTYTYQEGLGLGDMNLLSTVGAFLMASSFLPLLWNLFRSLKRGKPAGANPWGAATLEWSIPSPPPHYNFARLPELGTRDPLWHPERQPDLPAAGEHEGRHVEMPQNSFWPLILALGLLIAAAGALAGLRWVVLGVAFVLVGLYGWSYEPPYAEGHAG